MNIKNYTSEVPAERSIAQIEHLLVQAGATHIAKSYDSNKKVDGFIFELFVDVDKPLLFKLPSKLDKVFARMWKDVSALTIRTLALEKARREKVMAQAERTAWKLLYEVIQVNVSLIMIEQVKPEEVFMPYLYDMKSQQTLFEKFEGAKMGNLIGEGNNNV